MQNKNGKDFHMNENYFFSAFNAPTLSHACFLFSYSYSKKYVEQVTDTYAECISACKHEKVQEVTVIS